MAHMSAKSYDVAIIGAGVTGLLLADRLSRLNLSVCLLEKESRIPGGATRTNQGWLHSGAYSAASIDDESEAVEVGGKCAFGQAFFLNAFPECLIDYGKPSILLLQPIENRERIAARWNHCGISAREVSIEYLRHLEPDVRVDQFHGSAFLTNDCAMDTSFFARSVLCRLSENINNAVFTGVTIKQIDGDAIAIASDKPGVPEMIKARRHFYAAGSGIEHIGKTFYKRSLEQRFWKSHLAIYPRILNHNIYFTAKYEIGIFHHGSHSIVSRHGNSYQIDAPNGDVNEEEVSAISEKVSALVPIADVSLPIGVGCVKIDFGTRPNRSLQNAFFEIEPNRYVLSAGKMSQAPHVVLSAMRHCFGADQSDLISSRSVEADIAHRN